LAIAVHERGPADGAKVRIDEVVQTRYYARPDARTSDSWVTLARYVFVPPRDGARCTYRYTGEEQVQGPLPGSPSAPEWS
jgi:hypothetical protein